MNNSLVKQAIEDLKKGKLILVVDGQDREAEGDFVGLAEYATGETLNQMITYGRGLVCAPMTREIGEYLALDPMTIHNTESFGTAFTVSVDHKTTSTGISAFDRAKTIRALGTPESKPEDFEHPGHIFPLIAEKGGVLKRQGHTEAAVDLALMAARQPVAYICETLNSDGTMARLSQLEKLAQRLDMTLVTIQDIIAYRYSLNQNAVAAIAPIEMPTRKGVFTLTGYVATTDEQTQLWLSKGKMTTDEPLLLRLHSECFTGDILGSKRCDCGEQLQMAMRKIQMEKRGAVLYLRQEGRGIGLLNKLKTYKLQEHGYDTYDANVKLGFAPDERDYGVAAAILCDQGIRRVRLMTNNPSKVAALTAYGIEVVEQVPLETKPQAENLKYLKTKKSKFHHTLHFI
ncbi:bifunctional 3,4-dihydroxy-2-butanone-4-phosphate synthase/GTP cyclohydrolase II [Liquorilactobacillus capillatus]|nr:bifunctional 3,4-dihydroxy-2-butanone-4-phosphate synthase/GTP cyclohydrolase II [Liquorilactobacillus capillatus]